METTEVVVPVTAETTPPVTPAPAETASEVAAPVSGETTPESVEPKVKTFTQAELDAIVAKEKARVERKVRRELTAPQPAPVQSSEPAKPVISDFQTVDEYDRAMTKWAEDTLAAREAKKAQEAQAVQEARQRAQLESAYADREEAVVEKYPDYHQVTRNPNLPITQDMARVIQESDQGPEVAYYLGKNPSEAARIAQLSPVLQAKEIGRIEAKLSLPPPAKKTSSAPEPIVPVTPNGGGGYVLDTTDAKASEKVLSQPGGTSAWINAERARQQKAWEQRNR